MKASELESTSKRILVKEKGQFLDVFYFILVDAETGVNYILSQDIYNRMSTESLIPLLDASGKPLVASDEEIRALINKGADYAE